MAMKPTSLELCAGAGGQALGLEEAGFEHAALVEIDPHCCATLRLNRPAWRVEEADLTTFDAREFHGIELVGGGVPCPPFSKAGKQLGAQDERNLFPAAIRVVDETRPCAVMFENVRGLMDAVFEDYRKYIAGQIAGMGYTTSWKLLNASEFGVPQLRPRVIFLAIRNEYADKFDWPEGKITPPTVGETLLDLMSERGWRGAKAWSKRANEIAPTLVGGSKRHGGPDLGPTRAKRAWAALGVDGMGIADEAPARDFVGSPKLTVRMTARLQGFADHWQFAGKKTASYRQVGNAFPPPVAREVSKRILESISQRRSVIVNKIKAA